MSEATYAARAVTPPRGPRRSADPRAALSVAAACVVALAVIWVLAELVPAGRARDAALLVHFTQLGGPGLHEAAKIVIHLLDPVVFTLWALALVAIAVARGRLRLALAAAVVLACAPIAADRVKPLFAYHHVHIAHVFNGYASWPSGHSTAASALALCAALVAPPRLRGLVALAGAAFAVLVGLALLVDAWHLPSDVLGGYLFATLWTALAVAALRAAELRWPERHELRPSS